MHLCLGYWVVSMALVIHLMIGTSYELESKIMSCTADSTTPVVYADTKVECFGLCINAEDIICDLFSWNPSLDGFYLPGECVFRKDGCTGNLVQTKARFPPYTYRVT
jgi:hypothetical protein